MSKHHIYYVYLLKCKDGTYYTGVTNDVERRFVEHQEGKDIKAYTYRRRPVELVFYAEFSNIEGAIKKEKQIKKWSRKKKEALINDDFEVLPRLSKKSFNKEKFSIHSDFDNSNSYRNAEYSN